MTVTETTRRGLLGALLGLAFGWELIETLSSASPLYTGSPVGGAFGDIWPMVRLALHAVACSAALVAVGQLLNKTYRCIYPAIYGGAAVLVHVLGSGLQVAAIRTAKDQGSLQSESFDGLMLTVMLAALVGTILPLTTLVMGLKSPNSEAKPPLLPAVVGVVAVGIFGGLGYRAFVEPEGALAESLLTGDDDERLRAAIRLAERQPKTIPALDALSQTLASDDDKLARAAALALKRAEGDGVAPAKTALAATSPIVRVRAIEVLRVIGERAGPTEKSIVADVADALKPSVADPNAKVRAGAIEALRRLGDGGKDALLAAYRDPKALEFAADLEPTLLGLDDNAVKAAVYSRRLNAADSTARFVAARELGRLGTAAADTAPELVGRIVAATEVAQVKSAAATALRAIGPAAHPPIDRALASANAEVQGWLKFAKGEGEIPASLVDTNAFIPGGANPVQFLRNFVEQKSATEAQVPALAALIADTGESSAVRALAAEALMPLGPRAAFAAKALDAARREFDANVAQAATNAFLVVAPKETADVAAELASPYEPRRLITARALRFTTIARPEVATSLSIALVDEASSVRAAAAQSLGTFGSDAAHVLPALEKAKDDVDAHVRQMANTAYDNVVRGK